MKTKIVLLIAACAVVTLSFTFASSTAPAKSTNGEKTSSEPVGGFAAEDKF